MELHEYQKQITVEVLKVLSKNLKVGINLFTRGGKSYIALSVIQYLLDKGLIKRTNVIMLGPDKVVKNFEKNIANNFKYKDNIIYINYEKLSAGHTIEDCLDKVGVDKDSVGLIIFDEAHRALGEKRFESLKMSNKYIYGRYVIAMTATPYSNITGVNALETLVGADNIVSYEYSDALKDNVARKLNYVPALVSLDKNIKSSIDNIRKEDIHSKYVEYIIDKLDEQYSEGIRLEKQRIKTVISNNVQLSSKDGARVFVFFSTIEKMEQNKELIVDVVKDLYTSWDNTDVAVNFLNFTSSNSEGNINDIIDELGEDAKPFTVDVIATCEMGTMGIHPKGTQFAIVMNKVKSLQKIMQIIGRVTNLYAYDDTDTYIFDMQDCFEVDSKLKVITKDYKKEVNLGELCNLIYSEDSKDISEYSDVINLISDNSSIDLANEIVKIKLYENTLCDLDKLVEFIDANLSKIDAGYGGNILAFLNWAVRTSDNGLERRNKLALFNEYKIIRELAVTDINFDIAEILKYGDRLRFDSVDDYNKLAHKQAIQKINKQETRRKYNEGLEIVKNRVNTLKTLADRVRPIYWSTYAIDFNRVQKLNSPSRKISSITKVQDKFLEILNKVPNSINDKIYKKYREEYNIVNKCVGVRGFSYWDVAKTQDLYNKYIDVLHEYESMDNYSSKLESIGPKRKEIYERLIHIFNTEYNPENELKNTVSFKDLRLINGEQLSSNSVLNDMCDYMIEEELNAFSKLCEQERLNEKRLDKNEENEWLLAEVKKARMQDIVTKAFKLDFGDSSSDDLKYKYYNVIIGYTYIVSELFKILNSNEVVSINSKVIYINKILGSSEKESIVSIKNEINKLNMNRVAVAIAKLHSEGFRLSLKTKIQNAEVICRILVQINQIKSIKKRVNALYDKAKAKEEQDKLSSIKATVKKEAEENENGAYKMTDGYLGDHALKLGEILDDIIKLVKTGECTRLPNATKYEPKQLALYTDNKNGVDLQQKSSKSSLYKILHSTYREASYNEMYICTEIVMNQLKYNIDYLNTETSRRELYGKYLVFCIDSLNEVIKYNESLSCGGSKEDCKTYLKELAIINNNFLKEAYAYLVATDDGKRFFKRIRSIQ